MRLTLSPLTNLLFHLDCLSGTVLCAPSGYQALWKNLGLDAADQAALTRWKQLRTRHGGVMLADPQLAAAPLLVTGSYIDLAERQRTAMLRARNLGELESYLALLSNDVDARELRGITERFQERFADHWQRSLSGFEASFDDMAKLLGDPYLRQTLAKLSAFYEHAAQSGETYRIHLIIQPSAPAPSSTAFQLERDFVVEVAERGKAADIIDVVVHELCHALLYGMPTEAKLTLVQAFLASDDAHALVDYGVFDEALATSIGNGLVFRHYHPDADFARLRASGFRSLYKPAGALAAALFPQLEALLASEVTVTSGEVLRALHAAAKDSYRAHGPAPIDYLHSHVAALAAPLQAAAQQVRDAAFAGAPYLREFSRVDAEAQHYIEEHPLLSAAVYLPSDADLSAVLEPLGVSSATIAELRGKSSQSRGLVYAQPRTSKSYLFIFIARDAQSAEQLAHVFIRLRELRDGILFDIAGQGIAALPSFAYTRPTAPLSSKRKTSIASLSTLPALVL